MDAFAVSIAAGIIIDRLTPRHVFRLSFHFGLFQFMMPLIGWLAGRTIASIIEEYDHWVAFGLLGYIGGKMLIEAWQDRERKMTSCPTRGWTLVSLSVATSIDALAVGVSLALLPISIWIPSMVIGMVACLMTCIGITFGNKIGCEWGRIAEVVGGLVLLVIGTRILLSHLMA